MGAFILLLVLLLILEGLLERKGAKTQRKAYRSVGVWENARPPNLLLRLQRISAFLRSLEFNVGSLLRVKAAMATDR